MQYVNNLSVNSMAHFGGTYGPPQQNGMVSSDRNCLSAFCIVVKHHRTLLSIAYFTAPIVEVSHRFYTGLEDL